MTAPPSSSEIAQHILRIMPVMMKVVFSHLRDCDPQLIPAHFRLLGMLARRPWSLSELAEVQAVSLPTMSSTISALVERGWVERKRSEEDRRIVMVSLTPAGREVIQRAHQLVEQRLTEALSELSDQQREALMKGLLVLHDAFGHAFKLETVRYEG